MKLSIQGMMRFWSCVQGFG